MMASLPLIGGNQGRKHKRGKHEKDIKCIMYDTLSLRPRPCAIVNFVNFPQT